MNEYLKVSKVKAFIVAESNKQHQLGKPLVKALNDFIDRTLAASVMQADVAKQTRLEIPALLNKQLSLGGVPPFKTKPDLPFLHRNRLEQRIEKLSKGKVTMDDQFVVKLNGLLLPVLMSTIKGTTECRINKPILISNNMAVSLQLPARQLLRTKRASDKKSDEVAPTNAAPVQLSTVGEPLVDKQQSQRQTKIVKIGLHLNKSDLTATCQFFTMRDIARIETTVRERIFKGLLDSGFALDDLEQQIQIEVEIDDKKR